MDQENPYASPRFEFPSGQWPVIADQGLTAGPLIARSGNLLVFERGAVFPARCVICDQPTESRLRKRIEWCHPAVLLLAFCNLFILLIVYLAIRKRAQIDLGMCDAHLSRRRQRLITGWLAAVVGFVAFIGGIIGAAVYGDEGGSGNAAMMWGMILTFFLGLGLLVSGAYLTTNANGFLVKRIDKRYVRLRKISPEFLASLPELALLE